MTKFLSSKQAEGWKLTTEDSGNFYTQFPSSGKKSTSLIQSQMTIPSENVTSTGLHCITKDWIVLLLQHFTKLHLKNDLICLTTLTIRVSGALSLSESEANRTQLVMGKTCIVIVNKKLNDSNDDILILHCRSNSKLTGLPGKLYSSCLCIDFIFIVVMGNKQYV